MILDNVIHRINQLRVSFGFICIPKPFDSGLICKQPDLVINTGLRLPLPLAYLYIRMYH